jgi:glycosyltransferase involved in cell wall biosynthesis
MERLAKGIGPDVAIFRGFVNTEALADHYLAADVLVHPSAEDPHPLATSEAAYCGLPLIVSDRVGSVGPTDDVRPGVNALEYPFGNIRKLADAIAALTVDSRRRRTLSEESVKIGRGRTIDVSADGFLAAACGVQ